MLHIRNISDSNGILQILKDKTGSQQSWILSDLRTKKTVQEYFLKNVGYYPEESVLRVSDLWQKILFRIHPQVRILSRPALQTHIRYFLKKFADQLQLAPGSEPTLLMWMNDLAPLYFHPLGATQLEDFFKKFPEQATKWSDWWLRVRAAFSYFKSQNLMAPQWIPSFLQTESEIQKYWNQDLIVDLGGQLTYVEAGLFQNLAKTQDVLLLSPQIQSSQKFQSLLRPYSDLLGFTQNNAAELDIKRNRLAEIHKYNSSLASIKSTTSQIRQWLDDGVSPAEIAVIAPDSEEIWPCLKFHFEKEGIPFSRETKVSLQSLPEVQAFTSKLRTLGRNLSHRDLELSLYSQNKLSDLQYEKFISLFTHLYEDADYSRHSAALEILKADFDPQQALNSDEFLIRLIQAWASPDVPDWLESLIRQILAQFQNSISIPWTEWSLLSESILAHIEKTESTGHPLGVTVTSLAATHFLNAQYLILIEMSDEKLKVSQKRGMTSNSVNLIAQNLGFWLQDSEKSHLEFELAWLLQMPAQAKQFHFSMASLTGELQTPSTQWMALANSQKYLSRVKSTVVDSCMINSVDALTERLKQDLGISEVPKLKDFKLQKLSPSSFEAFIGCPFVYFARQTVGLQIFPEVDLEQDPRDKGRLIHKIFEKLMFMDRSAWAELNLENLIKEVISELHFQLDALLVPTFIKKYVALAQRFIEFETVWAEKYPKVKKHHLEVKWQGLFNDVVISGQIDRIDESLDGHLIVVDYKNSTAQLKGGHLWLEASQYQMFFYIWAIRQGWAQDLSQEVLAALYYVVKNFDRTIGLETTEPVDGFFQPGPREKQHLDSDQIELKLKEFENRLSENLERMKSGEISPVPMDETMCEKCDWRKVCRAPHL